MHGELCPPRICGECDIIPVLSDSENCMTMVCSPKKIVTHIHVTRKRLLEDRCGIWGVFFPICWLGSSCSLQANLKSPKLPQKHFTLFKVWFCSHPRSPCYWSHPPPPKRLHVLGGGNRRPSGFVVLPRCSSCLKEPPKSHPGKCHICVTGVTNGRLRSNKIGQ